MARRLDRVDSSASPQQAEGLPRGFRAASKRAAPSPPAALVCGLLEDNGRALFLMRKNIHGIETVEMPCLLLQKGDNPVAALSVAFRAQTGIDAQVHEILFEKRWNAGSRKKRAIIPALIFKVTAKNASVRVSNGFSGYKWLFEKEMPKYRYARTMQFL